MRKAMMTFRMPRCPGVFPRSYRRGRQPAVVAGRP